MLLNLRSKIEKNAKCCKRDMHEKYMDHYKRINFPADKNKFLEVFTQPDPWYISGRFTN